MSNVQEQLRGAVLALLTAAGDAGLGTGSLAAQLGTDGQTDLASLWALLRQLEREGVIIRSGGAARPRYTLRTLPPTPAVAAAVPRQPSSAPATVLPAPVPTPLGPALTPAAHVATPKPRRRLSPRQLPRTSKHRNLTRLEAGPKNRAGFLVRVRWAGAARGRFFADAEHGDRLGSLTAALTWRNKTEKELGKPATTHKVTGKANSNTGHVGITRTIKGGADVFQVSWIESGRLRRRTFNIARLGERRALRAALRARAEGEQRRLR